MKVFCTIKWSDAANHFENLLDPDLILQHVETYCSGECLAAFIGLEVRCNFNLDNATVLTSLQLGPHLPNAATAHQMTGAPNITMRIADRKGGDISSAKVSFFLCYSKVSKHYMQSIY